MYLILNTAISHRWGMPEPCPKDQCDACWTCFDCIRLYQDENDESHTLGCSPPAYPTAEFIAAHPERYAPWKPYTGPDSSWYPGSVTGSVKNAVSTSIFHF